MIAEVVHSYGKTMAASPFPTPKMSSRMVRQDWGKWNLDIVFPMVYHTFYTGDASFISDCTVENARDKNDMTTLYCGMTATDGPMMFECMDAALNNGAQGIAVFTMLGLRSPEVKKQFKAYTDSVRAVRAANGGVIKATYPKVAEPDPFKHEGIMKLMQERMQQIIATAAGKEEPAPLALGEYKEVDSYDATRCYQVVDNNSKTTFDVTFYLYGDVVSGWDVTVADKDSSSFERTFYDSERLREQTLSALCVFDGRHGLLQCSEWKEFARKESNVYGFTGRWGCAVLAGRERDRVSAP